MMIAFDVRPRDSRLFEAWQAYKLPLSMGQIRILYFVTIALGLVYAYHHPQLNLIVVMLVFGATYFAGACGLALFIRWRYRLVPSLVEGHHTLHLSAAGVHHTGPRGIDRYSWSGFVGLDVTVEYIFLRFREGALGIPVSALGQFGPVYDEAFLSELAPSSGPASTVSTSRRRAMRCGGRRKVRAKGPLLLPVLGGRTMTRGA